MAPTPGFMEVMQVVVVLVVMALAVAVQDAALVTPLGLVVVAVLAMAGLVVLVLVAALAVALVKALVLRAMMAETALALRLMPRMKVRTCWDVGCLLALVFRTHPHPRTRGVPVYDR
jgi:hypothetical protein